MCHESFSTLICTYLSLIYPCFNCWCFACLWITSLCFTCLCFTCLCFKSAFHLLVFHVSVFHQLSRAVCFTRNKLAVSTNQRFETMVSPAHYIALHYMTPPPASHNITVETMAGRAHCWGFWSAAHHRSTSSVFALVYVINYIVGHCLLKWRYLVLIYFGSFNEHLWHNKETSSRPLLVFKLSLSIHQSLL